jgi:hypothetical protein
LVLGSPEDVGDATADEMGGRIQSIRGHAVGRHAGLLGEVLVAPAVDGITGNLLPWVSVEEKGG